MKNNLQSCECIFSHRTWKSLFANYQIAFSIHISNTLNWKITFFTQRIKHVHILNFLHNVQYCRVYIRIYSSYANLDLSILNQLKRNRLLKWAVVHTYKQITKHPLQSKFYVFWVVYLSCLNPLMSWPCQLLVCPVHATIPDTNDGFDSING
jgi:hypothetical protein